jgi:hypothetical protein
LIKREAEVTGAADEGEAACGAHSARPRGSPTPLVLTTSGLDDGNEWPSIRS